MLLHNFCIRAGDFWDEPPDDYDDDGSDDDNNDVVEDGEHVRKILINYVNCLLQKQNWLGQCCRYRAHKLVAFSLSIVTVLFCVCFSTLPKSDHNNY